MEKLIGTCEGCNNHPRTLKKIESGQLVCQTCLREIRGPKLYKIPLKAAIKLNLDRSRLVTREEYNSIVKQCK
jgi:hypothetical protein